MKWKLHRQSYLIGILMGTCLGIGVGYISSVIQVVSRVGADNEGQVVLGIAALRKLDTNDVAGARKVLQWVVADNYLDEIGKKDFWWFQLANRNSRLVERVEQASQDLPSLAAAIEERKKSRSGRQAVHGGPKQPFHD